MPHGRSIANWKLFRQCFDLYLTATDEKNESDEQTVAMLPMIVGPTVTTTRLTSAKLESYFAPRRNEVYSRY